MRLSIVSIVVAGGLLALGACSTAAEPDAMALAGSCTTPRSELAPTGRQTGDARQDYRCRSVHVPTDRSARAPGDGAQRSAAIDRTLRNGG